MNIYSPRVDFSHFTTTTGNIHEATHIVCTDMNDYCGLLYMATILGCHFTVVYNDNKTLKPFINGIVKQPPTLWIKSNIYDDFYIYKLMESRCTDMISLDYKVVLITGCLGFIGSRVLEHLFFYYPRYSFIGFDINSTCSNQKNVSEYIRNSGRYIEIIGDLCSKHDVRRCFEFCHVNIVLHFAAESHVDTSFTNSAVFTLSNVYGTHVLIQQAHESSVDKFVHVSTDEVYGDIDYTNPADEHSLRSPTNPYAASKLGAEAIVQSYMKSFNFPAIITRGNNVYGPTQFCEKFIPKCIRRRHKGLPLLIHGDGSAQRSFLYISDVVSAFDVIMHKGDLGTIYNIGSDQELSVIDIAYDILRLIPKPGPGIEYVPDRCFNDKRYLIDSTRLHDLGWTQKVPFSIGLNHTFDWNTSQEGQEYWSEEVTLSALDVE